MSEGPIVRDQADEMLRLLLRPRIFFSLLALLGVAAATGVDLAEGPLVLLAVLLGCVVLFGFAVYSEKVLLAVLLLRPILTAIPDFTIAGHSIGLDGMLNTPVVVALMLALPLRRKVPYREMVAWCMVGLLFFALVSLRLSTDIEFGARQWFRFFGYLVFFWTAYSAAARHENYIERIRHVVILAAVLLITMGTAQILLLLREMSMREYVSAMFNLEIGTRLNGYQAYPHTYSFILLLCIPVLLWSAGLAQVRTKKTVYYGLAAVCVFFIILTGVRMTIGAVAVTVFVYMIATRRVGLLAVFVVFFSLAGFATGIFQARFNDLTDPTRATEWNSLLDRQEIWQVVDAGIRNDPWRGHGLGSVYQYVAMSPNRSNALELGAHNDYRKFLFEAGIPGFAFYVAMWASLLWKSWRIRYIHSFREVCFFAGGALTSLVCGFLTIAAVNELMGDYVTMTFFWSLAGAALGAARTRRLKELGIL